MGIIIKRKGTLNELRRSSRDDKIVFFSKLYYFTNDILKLFFANVLFLFFFFL